MPTTNLALGFLEPAQAQKHVIVNENSLLLDALVQANVVSMSLAVEPAAPSEGDVYILPPGKTGANWGPMANGALAFFRDGVWAPIAPRRGWTVYVRDEGQHVVYSGTAWGPILSAAQTAGFRNRLINAAFAINQRGATSVADDVYGFDRWYVLAESGSVTISALTNPEAGRPTGIRLTQPDASAKRIGLAQIVESANIRDLRAAAVAMAARVRCSAAQAIRIAILEWSGAADAVVSDVVNAWANASFAPSAFFVANISVTATGAATPIANAWTDLPQITGAFSGALTNAIVMIWSEAPLAQNATLDIDQVQLEAGAACGAFARRSIGEELGLCQRYFEALSTAATGSGGFSGYAASATIARTGGGFKVVKRAPPSLAYAGSNINVNHAGGNFTPSAVGNVSTSIHGFGVDFVGAGMTAGQGVSISIQSPNALTFDAEL